MGVGRANGPVRPYPYGRTGPHSISGSGHGFGPARIYEKRKPFGPVGRRESSPARIPGRADAEPMAGSVRPDSRPEPSSGTRPHSRSGSVSARTTPGERTTNALTHRSR